MKGLPFLLVLAAGAALMSAGKRKANPETDEIPESLDYNDENLKQVLEAADADRESEVTGD